MSQLTTAPASRRTFASMSGLLAIAFMLVVGSPAHAAATPDMSEIVTMITGLVAVVSAIGMAVLTVYATAKVFKWVKTAF